MTVHEMLELIQEALREPPDRLVPVQSTLTDERGWLYVSFANGRGLTVTVEES